MGLSDLIKKPKKRQVIIVSHTRAFYKLLILNQIKCKLYDSAFDLVENHIDDMKDSVIMVEKGIEIPEGLDCIRYWRDEMDIMVDLLNKYEFTEENIKEKEEDILNTRIVKEEKKEEKVEA